MDAWVVWLLIAGVLLIAEMLTFTLFLLWLGAGAAVAAVVAAAFPDPVWPQMLAGSAAALLLAVFAKPLGRKLRRPGESEAGYRAPIDELIGREGVVTAPIERGKPGIVKIGADSWSAISREPLSEGERVEVISRGTTIVHVRKKESAD